MINAKALLADLQKLLVTLELDLRTRCANHADVDQPLRQQYAAAKAANRTAQAYEVWRDEQITQAAVAWILGCVFVRFCEDNHLIDPPRLSGPGERRQRAEDEHTIYFQKHPTHSDREYLQWVFEQVAQLPAMKELFDKRHNPLWALGVSGDGAMALRNFFLRRDASTGSLVHDFTDPAFAGDGSKNAGGDPTRFLGDLYQDLSESARKKFALLQTPIFVEEFILDRTLMPAIGEFGFQTVRMIDPTCGSGHFLLGGFHRLFELWVKYEPGTNVRVLAQRALDCIYGVDLNPYAVAIARFRLLVATLRVCAIRRLADAPAFTVHVAAGDSLLHGPRPDAIGGRQQYLLGDDPLGHVYDTEDAPLLQKYLGQQYHAVVGNPPYITPKDKALNDEYRARFGSCHMRYSLAVPFFQRFFDLTENGDTPGFVGMITSNSFMKREFGKKLIEQYIPRWDLTHVVDTSGAYIPGHGTPTVIVFGRNRRPTSSTVRAVMGILGEPSAPVNPAFGLVWSAIMTQLDHPGSQTRFVSVADLQREQLHRHPWSMGGGGAAELRDTLDEASSETLNSIAESVGITAVTGEDDFYMLDESRTAIRLRIEHFVELVEGDRVRDWSIVPCVRTIWTFDAKYDVIPLEQMPITARLLWRWKQAVNHRRRFGTPMVERGLSWYEWQELYTSKFRSNLCLVFSEVSTHNNFVLDHGKRVYKHTAPIVKLPADATERDYFSILGLLNSSVACFWLKQGAHNKGDSTDDQGARTTGDPAFNTFAFNSQLVGKLPLVSERPVSAPQSLDRLARTYQELTPPRLAQCMTLRRDILAQSATKAGAILATMVALQEEMDWEFYGLYGLLKQVPRHETPPPLLRGQRSFEIVLARKMAAGEVESTWFERHGSTPITEIPADWPEDYKEIVRRRIEVIETDKNIGLIERPEYKRRWNTEPWEEMQERALRSWLLDRLEGWPLEKPHSETQARNEEAKGPRTVVWDEKELRLMSVAQLADRVRQDKDFMQVAALYRGREDFDLTKLVAELVENESVPALPVLRYKESGLRNLRVWEQVWDLQRLEDAIDARTKLPLTDPQYLTEQQANAEKKAKVGDIPVPPKYKSADMVPGPIWRLRGKLDVPKERFVSFPHCQRDADQSLVITWAGFDHLQQLQAVAAYYMDMKEREGWPAERRVPLLAAMLELLPWVLQWHNAVHPDFGVGLGDYYRDFINDEAKEMGKTVDEVKAWVPSKATGSHQKRKR